MDTRGRCGYEIGFLVQYEHGGGHDRSLGCAAKKNPLSRIKLSDPTCGVLTMLVAKIQFLRESINLEPICREAAWKHRHCLWRLRWWSSPSKHWETIWLRVQLHHVLVWLCRLLSRLRTSFWSARISSLYIQRRMASRKWRTCHKSNKNRVWISRQF